MSPRPHPQQGAGPRGTGRPPPCSLAPVIPSAPATPGGCGRGQWGSLARARRSSCGDSEAATKVVPSFSHAGPGQLCCDAEELRSTGSCPWPDPIYSSPGGGGGISRGHLALAVTHLGENGKIQESRGQACVPSSGTALRESHGSLVSTRRTCVLGAPAVAQRGGCYFGF